MQGYKTYTGIILAFLGLIGFGDLIDESQIASLIELMTGLIGIGLAVWGNYKAHRELKAKGGYRAK